jgi:hypothetical protein
LLKDIIEGIDKDNELSYDFKKKILQNLLDENLIKNDTPKILVERILNLFNYTYDDYDYDKFDFTDIQNIHSVDLENENKNEGKESNVIKEEFNGNYIIDKDKDKEKDIDIDINNSLSEEDFLMKKNWEEKMKDFEPAEIMTFEVNTEEVNINKE